MVKITIGMIGTNEEDFVGYSLGSIIDWADEVIFVDGGSKDATLDIVRSFGEKVRVFENPFKDLPTQRNIYLREATGDWIGYLDCDEVFKKEDLEYIRQVIESDQYDYLWIKSYHFWHDFWHITVGGHWDQSYLMQRFFRNEEGIYYLGYKPKVGDHTLLNVDASRFCDTHKGTLLPDHIRVYHYGHARGVEHEIKKMRFFLSYDYPEIPKDQWDNHIRKQSWMDDRWFKGINCDPEHVKVFKGEHPEIMRNHPLYKVRVITSDLKRLNLGAGYDIREGYINIDLRPLNGIQLVMNVEKLTPFMDGSVDEVLASHILEHFSWRKTKEVLREWIRVLRKGGILVIKCPNARYIAEKYVKGDPEFPCSRFASDLFGGQVHELDYHKTAFDFEMLKDYLSELGMIHIECLKDDWELIVRAVK